MKIIGLYKKFRIFIINKQKQIMKTIDTNFQKREYLKKVSAYSNFSLTLLGDKMSAEQRFNIAQFKIGFQLAKLMDFSNDKALDLLIILGNKIINITK